ncbi:MAG: hypothetical protein HY901_13260 [Deltaproteobacteria bacterium]|nr:hypothetical protein [Deltaproteobacteria bacterium]
MSAMVVLGVSASEFMETDYFEDAPQVHLHFLTGPDEYREQGWGRVELCCHGCGGSLLVYYNDSAEMEGRASHLELCEAFAARHQGCRNSHFERSCPVYRSSVEVADLRTRRRALLRAPEEDEPPHIVVRRVKTPKKPAAA